MRGFPDPRPSGPPPAAQLRRCGGGRLACPSDSMKNEPRFREIEGRAGSKNSPASDPGSRNSGLLVRLRRPSVVPSAWSLGWWIQRSATTPMGRRRPPSEPGQKTASCLPGEPGSAIVRNVPRCREVDGAQWRARHARGRLLSLGPGEGFGPVLGAAVLAPADDPCRHVLQGVPQSRWVLSVAPVEFDLEVSKRHITGTDTGPS